MNKVLMISALAFAVGSSSAMAANVYKDDTTSVDVYGYAKGAHVFTAHGQKNGFDKSEAQIGVKARQQLNKNFALLGQYEGEYDVNDTSARHWHNRKAFGGVDAGSAGVVTVGRQQGLIYNVTGFTDVNPEVVSGWSAAPDTGLLGRADSVIQYQNTIGGVTTTAQYKLESDKSVETGKAVNEGAAYGASVVANDISGTGVFVGAAYANQKITSGTGTSSDVYSVGAGVQRGPVYVAATSAFGKNAAGAKSFYDNEVIGTYTFDNGVSPALGYVDSNAFGSRAQFVETGLAYTFNKNVVGDVGFGYDVTGAGDHQTKVGMKYKF